MRWDGIFGEEESLDVVIELTLAFSAWQDEDDHLDTIVELVFESSDPSV